MDVAVTKQLSGNVKTKYIKKNYNYIDESVHNFKFEFLRTNVTITNKHEIVSYQNKKSKLIDKQIRIHHAK